MTKSTSTKSTALSLITKKMQSERQLNQPDPFYEKSPEHPRSPSSSSEEEELAKKPRKRPDKDEVSQVLDLDGKEDKEDEKEDETESSDEEKAAKPDSTAKVSEKAEPISLDELLEQVSVSAPEHKSIKDDLLLWYLKDLKHLSPAEIVTELQYCSRSARQALYWYTIAAQLNDSAKQIKISDRRILG